MKEKIKTVIRFIINPHLLPCFILAWMITNGWAYILFAIGSCANIKWMCVLSGAYLAFLWLPISPEKIVTILITIFLLRILFPNDEYTLTFLKKWHKCLVNAFLERKKRKK